MKIIRPDKLELGIKKYILNNLGEKFCHSFAEPLSEAFKDSSNQTPLIFILSSGANPMS